ncbi:MAG: uncharacterized protein JWN51_2600 [Phycisphaerales bacterium]|nr:uncharacterized protein [Phycisphaerales bacterium]
MPDKSGQFDAAHPRGAKVPLQSLGVVTTNPGNPETFEYVVSPARPSSSTPGTLTAVAQTPLLKNPAAQAREAAARGDVMFLRGQYKPALDYFLECVRLQPGESDYHFKLAATASRLDQPRWVEPHFREAVRLNPGHAMAQKALAQWAIQNGDIATALRHSASAIALMPMDVDTIAVRAIVLSADGQLQPAMQLIEPLLARGSDDLQLVYAYAHLAPKIGHESQAAALIERALKRTDISPAFRPRLMFAAAGLLDAVGRHDEAFAHAKAANALARRPFNSAAYSELVNRNTDYFTRDRLRALPRATPGNRRPVFILGMPRSGTSLVEQILATHPSVFGGGELGLVAGLTRAVATAPWAGGATMPRCLDNLTLQEANSLAAQYHAGIQSLGSAAPVVTDKMPLNFLVLGLIQVLLPESRVIHCLRDPRDTCLSCYFTDFAIGNEFTFDLGQLATFHRDYARMMRHWKQVVSLPMLEVRYEDLVADKEKQTRRMLEFLDLPWDDRCLLFHQNKRFVATASREQVRKPIYSSSVGRWKHYEKYIPELLSNLP